MPNHSITRYDNQGANRAYLEIVENDDISTVVEVLRDEKYPWIDRKKKTLRLADIYRNAGYDAYADRAKSCACRLTYNAMLDGRRTLRQGMFCKLRLCPMCNARRAKKAAIQLSRAMSWVEQQHPGSQFLFLTLTIKNCKGDKLSEALDTLLGGWSKLTRHRQVARAIKGWYRALEITKHGDMYHPHIHAILVVEDAYFKLKNGLYITQKQWEAHWQVAMGVSYKPMVDIRATHGRGRGNKEMAATTEAAKYATKDSDYIGDNITMADAVQTVTIYTKALYRRRLVAFGGWIKDAARALSLDIEADDLVHLDDTAIRDDVAELVEVYGWHFGFGDYQLLLRQEAHWETTD